MKHKTTGLNQNKLRILTLFSAVLNYRKRTKRLTKQKQYVRTTKIAV